MSRVGVTCVTGQFDLASGLQKATVWIERPLYGSPMFCVRPFKRRRVYALPLSEAASWLVKQTVLSELRAKRAEKEAKRKKPRLVARRKA